MNFNLFINQISDIKQIINSRIFVWKIQGYLQSEVETDATLRKPYNWQLSFFYMIGLWWDNRVQHIFFKSLLLRYFGDFKEFKKSGEDIEYCWILNNENGIHVTKRWWLMFENYLIVQACYFPTITMRANEEEDYTSVKRTINFMMEQARWKNER